MLAEKSMATRRYRSNRQTNLTSGYLNLLLKCKNIVEGKYYKAYNRHVGPSGRAV
jgi:hypothetical protein